MSFTLTPAHRNNNRSHCENHIMSASDLVDFQLGVLQVTQPGRLHSTRSIDRQSTINEADEDAAGIRSIQIDTTVEIKAEGSEDSNPDDGISHSSISERNVDSKQVAGNNSPTVERHLQATVEEHHCDDSADGTITFGPMTHPQSQISNTLNALCDKFVPVYRNLRRHLIRLERLDRKNEYISLAHVRVLKKWIHLTSWRQCLLLESCRIAYTDGMWENEEIPYVVDRCDILITEMAKAITYGKRRVEELKGRDRPGEALADAFRKCAWLREEVLGGQDIGGWFGKCTGTVPR